MRQGMVFIPPYDDPYIIAGQGTAGAEILRQLSSHEKENLEAIFVAIGGGGLAAGVAAYTKQLLPPCQGLRGGTSWYIFLSSTTPPPPPPSPLLPPQPFFRSSLLDKIMHCHPVKAGMALWFTIYNSAPSYLVIKYGNLDVQS